MLDPGGLIKSQVVQSPDGALRMIALNAPPNRSAPSPRAFLTEAFRLGRAATLRSPPATWRRRSRAWRRTASRCCAFGEESTTTISKPKNRPVAAAHRRIEGAQYPLRPRWRHRIPAGLHQDLRGAFLLRDRGAARLPGLRRRQRLDPPRRPDAPRSPSGNCRGGRKSDGGIAPIGRATLLKSLRYSECSEINRESFEIAPARRSLAGRQEPGGA